MSKGNRPLERFDPTKKTFDSTVAPRSTNRDTLMTNADRLQQRLEHQAGNKPAARTYYLPIQNVEDALHQLNQEEDFAYKFEVGEMLDPKTLYKRFTSQKRLSSSEICAMLCDRHDEKMGRFAEQLTGFLCR